VFATPDGKKVLQDLMEYCKLNKTCFDKEPMEMARMEGERNVALRILSILGTDETKLLEMFEDNTDRNGQYYEEDEDGERI
jgi:hypothetical protein